MEHIFYLPSSMLWPLAACLVLTGIHVYLGVHVIARKVIFVDLALAQIAALGTMIGVLLGYETGKDTTALYLYSLAFTVFGAFVFSITRMKGEKIPHEAIIGIVYAVTFAATMLVLSQSAMGPQELDHIIKGELLWVQPSAVIKTAVIYLVVGMFHFVYRKKFMAISNDPQQAEQQGINVQLWDFLFYMSFGFVITSSVSIAGVFLVFSYLVIPSVGAMLLSERLRTRLIIGWISGGVISLIGIKVSWDTGLPTSPLIVVLLAFALMIAALIRFIRVSEDKRKALISIVRSLAAGTIFLAGIWFFQKHEEDPYEHSIHQLESKNRIERLTAIRSFQQFPDMKHEWLPLIRTALLDNDVEIRKSALEMLTQFNDSTALDSIIPLLTDRDEGVRRSAIAGVKMFGTPESGNRLLQLALDENDPEIMLSMVEAALELENTGAIPVLIAYIGEGSLFSKDALDILRSHVEIPHSITSVKTIQEWWEIHKGKLRWDRPTHRYVLP